MVCAWCSTLHSWGARAIEVMPHETCRGEMLVVAGWTTIPPLATVVGVTFGRRQRSTKVPPVDEGALERSVLAMV